MTKKDNFTEPLEIKNVPKETKETLRNIAENTGLTLSGLMKSHLPKIIDSYPPHMRVKREL